MHVKIVRVRRALFADAVSSGVPGVAFPRGLVNETIGVSLLILLVRDRSIVVAGLGSVIDRDKPLLDMDPARDAAERTPQSMPEIEFSLSRFTIIYGESVND